MRNCYTYLIGWTKHDVWYYGRRTSKTATPDDLWKTYFTSSKHVKEFREMHGDPDVIDVRKEFGDDVKKCAIFEHTVLRRLNVKKILNF